MDTLPTFPKLSLDDCNRDFKILAQLPSKTLINVNAEGHLIRSGSYLGWIGQSFTDKFNGYSNTLLADRIKHLSKNFSVEAEKLSVNSDLLTEVKIEKIKKCYNNFQNSLWGINHPKEIGGLYGLIETIADEDAARCLTESISEINSSFEKLVENFKIPLNIPKTSMDFCKTEIQSGKDFVVENIGLFDKVKFQFVSGLNNVASSLSLQDHFNEILFTNNRSIIISALPQSSYMTDDAQRFKDMGVTTVISMTQYFETTSKGVLNDAITPQRWKELDIEHHQFPIPDHSPISVNDLEAAVNLIHKVIGENTISKGVDQNLLASERLPQKILVHCKSGISRSVAVPVCYLIKYHNYSAEEALNFVKSVRKTATSMGEKSSKLKFIYEFAEKYPKKQVAKEN